MDDLNPGHYQFKATKRGFADSPVAERDLTAGENLTLNLTLRANERFLKRLSSSLCQRLAGYRRQRPKRRYVGRTRREQAERMTFGIVGGCFIALALCILYESGSTLIGRAAPERSIPGINSRRRFRDRHAASCRAKRRVAAGIGSGAMRADS
jgi:hypothetical protein